MTTQFDNTTAELIAHVTNSTNLPPHAQLMADISIKEGGLGIQNPQTNAINAYMTTSKRCLQYSQEGVWLGFNKNRPQFPPAIQLLFNDWDSSSNRSWVIFNKYHHTFNNISFHQPESPTDYIYKASLNGSREKIKEHSSRQIKTKVLFNKSITPPHIHPILRITRPPILRGTDDNEPN
jgi:hypothetical protein